MVFDQSLITKMEDLERQIQSLQEQVATISSIVADIQDCVHTSAAANTGTSSASAAASSSASAAPLPAQSAPATAQSLALALPANPPANLPPGLVRRYPPAPQQLNSWGHPQFDDDDYNDNWYALPVFFSRNGAVWCRLCRKFGMDGKHEDSSEHLKKLSWYNQR